MARSPSITLVLSLLMGILATVCPQECSEDPATSLVGQLVGLVGERAGRTCDVCSGVVMAKVEEVSAEVSAAKEEHRKELGDVQELVRSVQEESRTEREGILASLVEAQGDREAIRESLALAEERTDVKLEELRSEVAAMNLDAHNNLTAVAQQLRTEIEELKTMLENIQSFIKGGARTSRDAPSTCADNQVMLASMGYLAPVESGTYKNNTDCTWVIERPPGYKIKITWLMFALERCTDCKCDYVEIWDGNTTKELIGGKRYCGYLDPPTMTSTSNRVEIKFHSNDVRTYAGFKIKYESVED
ncbi:suppressor of tumorigenicity 14 protein-like isoform X1 [Penaeus japonicus]|uniref:suppressor of tumorigenicity 14 protein-like isoform X1 n=1 Tax=Penaeus japonicus TaxID=27405 RepID=UPI001C713399|nr:suppressor of tumorigenicity 14 protein-like isoform X1 [Penaeus japonicus]